MTRMNEYTVLWLLFAINSLVLSCLWRLLGLLLVDICLPRLRAPPDFGIALVPFLGSVVSVVPFWFIIRQLVCAIAPYFNVT